MSRKNDILTNLREYSSDQIAEAINDGVVTMYELSKSGNLTPLMRKRIEEKLATGSSATSNEETKRSQDDRQLSDVEASVNKVGALSNEETEHEKITVPEIVIPEAVIAPMDQTVECELILKGKNNLSTMNNLQIKACLNGHSLFMVALEDWNMDFLSFYSIFML